MNYKVLLLLTAILAITYCSSASTSGKPKEDVKFFIFTETCFDTFFVKQDFMNQDCLKVTASKFVGASIVTLSLIVKVPQILKITGNSSTEGLVFSSFFSELILYTLTVGYNLKLNNPFNLYGENVFISVQNVVILLLFFKYDKVTSRANMTIQMILYIFIAVPTFLQMIPDEVYNYSMYINMLIHAFARIPQILLNFKNKSTGQLAFFTAFLNFGGAVARLMTQLTENPDDILSLLMTGESLFLNGLLFLQFFLFWNSTTSKKTEQKTKKE